MTTDTPEPVAPIEAPWIEPTLVANAMLLLGLSFWTYWLRWDDPGAFWLSLRTAALPGLAAVGLIGWAVTSRRWYAALLAHLALAAALVFGMVWAGLRVT